MNDYNWNLDAAIDAVEIVCNIDDMTGEELGYAANELLKAGALDVGYMPIFMKKNRPAYQLTVLASPAEARNLAAKTLSLTTSNGVRLRPCERMILQTSQQTVETSFGSIRIKQADGYGIRRYKPEADDIADAARRHNLPFHKVRLAILQELENRFSDS